MSEVTKMSGPVHGYKVFYSNWTCRPAGAKPKQYTCPGKFEEEGEIEIEQNRCAMSCQGCGAVFLSLNQKAVETKS